MAEYIALIHKDPHSDYAVSFPDFDGCITAAPTLDQARVLASEALALHVQGMREDGEGLPEPSSLQHVMATRENRAAVAFLVEVPERPTPAVRINITVTEGELQAIDSYATAHGYSRSAFLVRAARQAMGRAA